MLGRGCVRVKRNESTGRPRVMSDVRSVSGYAASALHQCVCKVRQQILGVCEPWSGSRQANAYKRQLTEVARKGLSLTVD